MRAGLRTFDNEKDQKTYQLFMDIKPFNGLYQVKLDENQPYGTHIEARTHKSLLEEWLKHYIRCGIGPDILNILKLAIADLEAEDEAVAERYAEIKMNEELALNELRRNL
jgi:hypothetical protein